MPISLEAPSLRWTWTVAVDVDPERIAPLVAGAAMILLAGWIYGLNLASRLNRSFALFLAVGGAISVLLAISGTVTDLLGRIRTYFEVGLFFAALNFGRAAWLAYGTERPSRWLASPLAPGAILLGVLVAEGAYVFDRAAFVARGRLSPNDVFIALTYFSLAGLALLFAVATLRTVPSPRRRSLLLLATGFALLPAYASLRLLLNLGFRPPGPDLMAGGWFALYVATFLLCLTVPATLAGRSLGAGHAAERPTAVRAAFLVLAAMGTAVVWLAFRAVPPAGEYLAFGFAALWRFAMVASIAYVVLRHHLLDIDAGVRWTMSGGVVASAFVATFFVVTEFLAYFLGRQAENAYIGIVATGGLLFVLAPLKRLGDRVAKAALPGALPVDERSLDERLALLAEQTRIAWEDGVLSPKERRMLEHARERLGVSDADAMRLERQVLASLRPARGTKARARRGRAREVS